MHHVMQTSFLGQGNQSRTCPVPYVIRLEAIALLGWRASLLGAIRLEAIAVRIHICTLLQDRLYKRWLK